MIDYDYYLDTAIKGMALLAAFLFGMTIGQHFLLPACPTLEPCVCNECIIQPPQECPVLTPIVMTCEPQECPVAIEEPETEPIVFCEPVSVNDYTATGLGTLKFVSKPCSDGSSVRHYPNGTIERFWGDH
jgi:hypothetical protein